MQYKEGSLGYIRERYPEVWEKLEVELSSFMPACLEVLAESTGMTIDYVARELVMADIFNFSTNPVENDLAREAFSIIDKILPPEQSHMASHVMAYFGARAVTIKEENVVSEEFDF
jgi:hypothetical protein